jgi:hypothetical protein
MNDTVVWKENKLMEGSADNMSGNTPIQSHVHGKFYESLYLLCNDKLLKECEIEFKCSELMNFTV